MKFVATLLDGRTLTEADHPSVSGLPLEQVVELVVRSDDDAQPVVLQPNLAAGERVHFFTRHTVPVGNPGLPKLSVPVYEIRKDEVTVCRLYWHPERGPLLTSQDIYF
jgi:hypothetical protein